MSSPRWSDRVARVLVALLAGIVLAGCGGSGPGPARLGVSEDQLLSFSGATLAGADLDARTLEGKPAVFWFWAPWCSICRAEAPGVERVAERFGDRARFVGVPGLGKVPAMERFVDDTGTTALTHVVDRDGSLWKRFGITSQPSFVFVSADGGVTAVHGGMKESELTTAVTDLLDG